MEKNLENALLMSIDFDEMNILCDLYANYIGSKNSALLHLDFLNTIPKDYKGFVYITLCDSGATESIYYRYSANSSNVAVAFGEDSPAGHNWVKVDDKNKDGIVYFSLFVDNGSILGLYGYFQDPFSEVNFFTNNSSSSLSFRRLKPHSPLAVLKYKNEPYTDSGVLIKVHDNV